MSQPPSPLPAPAAPGAPDLMQLAAGLQLEIAFVNEDDQVVAATALARAHLDAMNAKTQADFVSRVCTLVRANGSATLTQPEAGLEVYGFVCPTGVGLVFAGVAFPRTPTARGLREVYGLTQAEARVACALASRESPKQIAEHFGVEVSTVRTHLRAIQTKLGATSQTDLIRRLIWSAATFVRDATPPTIAPSEKPLGGEPARDGI
jgi:DNA-binding CsgD family transcriptional regulator